MLEHNQLAAVHIVKKELNLTDDAYRDILQEVAGVRSARDLDAAGFRKLMRYFARSRYYMANPEGMTLKQKLYIRHLVDDLGWNPDHFRNFLHKYYKKMALERYSRQEAGKVINGLKSIISRQAEGLSKKILDPHSF